MAVVGVDPGGRQTGVVTRIGGGVSAAAVLKRKGNHWCPNAEYIAWVLSEVESQLGEADTLAVEGLHEPSPHLGMIRVNGLIGTAMVYGAVLARWPDAIVIEPEGNGSLPDFAYPSEIRKNVRLGGRSDHARSAYDVAGAGELLARAARAKGRNAR